MFFSLADAEKMRQLPEAMILSVIGKYQKQFISFKWRSAAVDVREVCMTTTSKFTSFSEDADQIAHVYTVNNVMYNSLTKYPKKSWLSRAIDYFGDGIQLGS